MLPPNISVNMFQINQRLKFHLSLFVCCMFISVSLKRAEISICKVIQDHGYQPEIIPVFYNIHVIVRITNVQHVADGKYSARPIVFFFNHSLLSVFPYQEITLNERPSGLG